MNDKKHLPKHSYTDYENTPLWNAIDKTLSELEQNQDLKLLTPREYVVGYICKQIRNSKETE